MNKTAMAEAVLRLNLAMAELDRAKQTFRQVYDSRIEAEIEHVDAVKIYAEKALDRFHALRDTLGGTLALTTGISEDVIMSAEYAVQRGATAVAASADAMRATASKVHYAYQNRVRTINDTKMALKALTDAILEAREAADGVAMAYLGHDSNDD